MLCLAVLRAKGLSWGVTLRIHLRLQRLQRLQLGYNSLQIYESHDFSLNLKSTLSNLK